MGLDQIVRRALPDNPPLAFHIPLRQCDDRAAAVVAVGRVKRCPKRVVVAVHQPVYCRMRRTCAAVAYRVIHPIRSCINICHISLILTGVVGSLHVGTVNRLQPPRRTEYLAGGWVDDILTVMPVRMQPALVAEQIQDTFSPIVKRLSTFCRFNHRSFDVVEHIQVGHAGNRIDFGNFGGCQIAVALRRNLFTFQPLDCLFWRQT